MPTGYDLLEHNHEFRMHMLKRFAASVVDSVLVFIPVTLFVFLLALEPKEILTGVLSGFCWFVYATISESRTGATVGKGDEVGSRIQGWADDLFERDREERPQDVLVHIPTIGCPGGVERKWRPQTEMGGYCRNDDCGERVD